MDRLWSIVAMIVCATFAGRIAPWSRVKSSDGKRDNASVLPRLFLIEELLEKAESVQLKIESHGDQYGEFARALCKILNAVKQAIMEPGGAEGKRWLSKFVEVVDSQLVCFLTKSDMGSILDMYLPKAGETWNSFLQNKTKEEQDFLGLDSRDDKEFPYLELKEFLLDRIEELQSLNQRAADDTDFYRSTADGEEVPVEEIAPHRYEVVKVLYATDREVTTDGEYIGMISKRSQSQPLHYGWVEVGIPAIHQEGRLEAPAQFKEEADPCKHVVILSINTRPRGDFDLFVRCIKDDRSRIGDGTGEILVYIHGYNARHLNTIKRVAQLKCDLKFNGTVILYSWSSQGTLSKYKSDESNVRKTEYSLQAFLKNITQKVQASRVHLLAHSMGGRALVGALLRLDAEQSDHHRPLCPISQIVFVAADEDRERFEKLVLRLNQRNKSTTSRASAQTSGGAGRLNENQNGSTSNSRPYLSVYCSTGDWPLAVSKLIHGGTCRLGDTSSLFTSESAATLGGHDVIDASCVKGGSPKHHSYHLESPTVIEDIRKLLAQVPARERNLEFIQHKGRNFYAFDKTLWMSNTTCLPIYG